DAIRKLENACVVGDDNECPVGALRNAAQYFHYASPRLMIQIARRFVADDELRVVNQCPGDSHALLLSAAKLERSCTEAYAQSYRVKDFARTGLGAPARYTVNQERYGDVINRG